jgi:signal transduction histidine kinase
LSQRTGVVGRPDEIRRLARSLDELMDRMAAGYEGQRSFAANASHELRTPLAVQRTLIEVGMTGPLSPPQLELLTRQLLETNERNEALIEGLLTLSESDRGLVSKTPQRLDLITRDVLSQHEEMANKADVSLQHDLSACTVTGEQVLLERLVTNLIQNAIKYNVHDGSVTVTVTSNGQLLVTNTGETVPAESVAGLFEPFRRLTSTRLHHSGSAGLGLTIARSISQAHGATIGASPGPDGGLTVTVTFAPH